MLQNLGLPVDAVESIGTKTARRLQDVGVRSVLDLISTPRQALHHAVRDVASERDVLAWQRMAVLMQIDTVDGQCAEALLRADMSTLQLCAASSLLELNALFREARANGTIPHVPGLDDLVEIIRQASVLAYGSSLTAKVVLENGTPVAGAVVRGGHYRTATNASGRFKLCGLPGATAKLVIDAEGGERYVIGDYRVMPASDDSAVQLLVLREDTRVGTSVASEYDGDDVPPMAGYRIVNRHEDTAQLRDGDVLRVRSVYSDGEAVKLQSIFNDFNGAEFVTRSFRFPRARLSVDVEAGDAVIYNGKGFQKTRLNPHAIHTWKRIRRFEKTSPRPKAASKDELRAYMTKLHAYLRENV